MKRHRLLKILFAASLLLVVLAALAWFFPQQVLTVDSGSVKGDVLVVLGGYPDRAVRAAELFKQGEASKVAGERTWRQRIEQESAGAEWRDQRGHHLGRENRTRRGRTRNFPFPCCGRWARIASSS